MTETIFPGNHEPFDTPDTGPQNPEIDVPSDEPIDVPTNPPVYVPTDVPVDSPSDLPPEDDDLPPMPNPETLPD